MALSPIFAHAQEAWAAYARTQGAVRAEADRLGSVDPRALAKASGRRYRTLMRYLLAYAPPAVRACFLEPLMDDTLTATIFTRACMTAIGSVDGALVRARLPAFAWKALEADPEDSDTAALHLLWLYGQFAAVRMVMDSWRSRGGAGQLQGFEATHPMPAASSRAERDRVAAARAGEAGRAKPRPGSAAIVTAAQVDQATRAWDEFTAASTEAGDAERAITAFGPRSVLEHAISAGGGRECVAWLLARWFPGDGFADAVALLGDSFFAAYFDALLDVAASDTFVAAELLRSLRRSAARAGRGDLISAADRVETGTYGVHDPSGLLIKVRG